MSEKIIRFDHNKECRGKECEKHHEEKIIGDQRVMICNECLETIYRIPKKRLNAAEKKRIVDAGISKVVDLKKGLSNTLDFDTEVEVVVKKQEIKELIKVNHFYNESNLITMKRMRNNEVDYIFTSPPYNVTSSPNGDKYVEHQDDMTQQEYFDWQKETIKEMIRVTKNHVFYNIQMLTGNKIALLALFGEFKDHIKEVMIWDKKKAEPSQVPGVMQSLFEFCIVFSKYKPHERVFHDFNSGTDLRMIPNMFRIKPTHNKFADVNKAVFPIELPRYFINLFGKEGDVWYDPYGGTGTTAEACELEKRKWILSEKDPRQIPIIRDRLESYKVQTKMELI